MLERWLHRSAQPTYRTHKCFLNKLPFSVTCKEYNLNLWQEIKSQGRKWVNWAISKSLQANFQKMFKSQKMHTDNTRSCPLFSRNVWKKKATSPSDVSVHKNISVCDMWTSLSLVIQRPCRAPGQWKNFSLLESIVLLHIINGTTLMIHKSEQEWPNSEKKMT